MSTLILTNIKVSGASAGLQVSGEIVLFVRGVFDGATVEMEFALTDTPSDYVTSFGPGGAAKGALAFTRPGTIAVDVQNTPYWVRAVVRNAGPKTNITLETNYAA